MRARHEQAYLLAKGQPARPADPLDDVRTWKYSGNVRHPTEKDVRILRPLIEQFSNPGDLVMDPFTGSGSTLVAAAMADRRYLGIELERQYCKCARQRLASLVNSRAARNQDDDAGETVDVALRDFWSWLRERSDHEAARKIWEVIGTSPA